MGNQVLLLMSRNGREGKVFVWKLQDEDEVTLETGVPGDGGPRRKPWLLHSLDVKEMTFCGVDVAFVNQVLPHSWCLLTRGRADCNFVRRTGGFNRCIFASIQDNVLQRYREEPP